MMDSNTSIQKTRETNQSMYKSLDDTLLSLRRLHLQVNNLNRLLLALEMENLKSLVEVCRTLSIEDQKNKMN